MAAKKTEKKAEDKATKATEAKVTKATKAKVTKAKATKATKAKATKATKAKVTATKATKATEAKVTKATEATKVKATKATKAKATKATKAKATRATKAKKGKGKMAKVVTTSGKRKTAIARAALKAGKGRVRVNSKPIEILQPILARRKAMEPLVIAEAMNRLAQVDINIRTHGGGIMGQTDAIRTAIARGLVHYNGGAEGVDEELRDEYLRYDRSLLVNDPRRKEAKHQLGRGARKKKQKSYR